MKTKIAHSAAEATATKASCEVLYVPPGGRRREGREHERERRHHDQRREAGARPFDTKRLLAMRDARPRATQRPTTPVQMIITAA